MIGLARVPDEAELDVLLERAFANSSQVLFGICWDEGNQDVEVK